jgi:quercetin 2,3-dioxygenase
MHNPLLQVQRLGFPWQTLDPFLFCVYHDDAYPCGNAQFGPDAPLAGRNLGQDFEGRDGWRMYHGLQVPGFPQHPHRGFETVTIVRKGLVDHSDSLGATARFCGGDVQWLTAGSGILHSEMFPLLQREQPNPLELFQIWLNLPARRKMAPPHFTMFWAEHIPQRHFDGVDVSCIAGRLADALPLQPPPASGKGTRRQLYFFKGDRVSLAGQTLAEPVAVELAAAQPVDLANGSTVAEFLLLQGRPIGEPVAQHGPFVMNTRQELQQAFNDYQRTQFGGWPWPDNAPVHGADPQRFARHAGGRVETPG